ncbi:MAG: epoxyqueuosine reductase [Nitrospinae bacterium]|nr:epoxyqueuosine reductase [Nitrospinota bacterium]
MYYHDYHELKSLAEEWGVTLFGVGDVRDILNTFELLPKDISDGLVYGISMGIRLSGRIMESIKDGPTKLYYYHYRRVNIALDQVAIMITNHIQRSNFNALPIPSSQTIDWENQRAHLSHKAIGVMAGIGWIGRNNLLVNRDHGSLVRYVTVLTDMPLKVDSPSKEDCGECTECMKICPVGAIKESFNDYNRDLCLERLKWFSKKYHIGHYICGICVKVCKGKKPL